MCHSDDSTPPPLPGDIQQATLCRSSLGAPAFRVAHARPERPVDVGVLLVPDGRGLHPFYERLALGFATVGIEAVALDLYGRSAGTEDRGPEFVSRDHSAQLRWDTVRSDLRTARVHLESRRAVVVGFCLGGRISLLAATSTEVDIAGAIAFYPQTSGPTRSNLPAPDERISQLRVPVLCMFGGSDELISNDAVSRWATALETAPVEHEVVTYPGAPHSFFDRRATQHAAATADAARRVAEFVRTAA